MQPRKIPPKRNVVALLDNKLLLQFAECILLCSKTTKLPVNVCLHNEKIILFSVTVFQF